MALATPSEKLDYETQQPIIIIEIILFIHF